MSETFKLYTMAHARSGDKGSMANIGVIAYNEADFRFLEKFLTEEKVADYFKSLHPKSVRRYLLPNLFAFNFLLEGVLGEGGSLSLRCDAQGKSLGQALLEMEFSREKRS